MLLLIVNVVVFIAALLYLNKLGFDQSSINLMLAGMAGTSLVGNVAAMIVAVIALNPMGIVLNLVVALLNLFFFNLFVKRAE